jgi:hypothetical protein
MIRKVKDFFKSLMFKQWFLVSAGYFMSSSTCPFCGKPGCPVGLGVGVGVGGFGVLCTTFIQRLYTRLKNRNGLQRSKNSVSNKNELPHFSTK